MIAARSRPRRLRRVLRGAAVTVAAIVAVSTVLISVSVVGALRTPGNEGFRAKWADWLRDHHAGVLVASLENWYFDRQQPPAGGRPTALNALPSTSATRAPAEPRPARSNHLPKPTDIPLLVQPGLTDEGRWQPTGPLIDGAPAMYAAQFRADDVYTSQLTTAVWWDPSLLRLRLVPGTREPAKTQWQEPSAIEGDARTAIVAAFNGGFRFKDAHGGFYLDGTEAVPLRDGAASIVIYRDGRVDVGSWGRDMSMRADVEAVLQNLTLLVDGGAVDSLIGQNDTRSWGATVKGHIAVARSGLGVTARGGLVYVAGPALSAKSLAESLQRAGAVRAIALDINPEWVTFNFFQHTSPTDPSVVSGVKLYPEMQRPGDRYLTPDSRDFFTLSQN